MNAAALIRGMFRDDSDKPQPGLRVFLPDCREASFLPAAIRRVISGAAFSLQYGEPVGDAARRQAHAGRLNPMAIAASSAQIIINVGAARPLDMVSRMLLCTGDCVVVEEPGWAIEFVRLEALGMRILPVPLGPDGLDLAVLAGYCELHQPKQFVSVSVLHNPTGCCLSPAARTGGHVLACVSGDKFKKLAVILRRLGGRKISGSTETFQPLRIAEDRLF